MSDKKPNFLKFATTTDYVDAYYNGYKQEFWDSLLEHWYDSEVSQSLKTGFFMRLAIEMNRNKFFDFIDEFENVFWGK